MVKKNATRKVYAPLVGCLQLNYMGYFYVPERDQPRCSAEVKAGVTVEIIGATPGPVKDAPINLYTRVAGSLTGREHNVWRRAGHQ